MLRAHIVVRYHTWSGQNGALPSEWTGRVTLVQGERFALLPDLGAFVVEVVRCESTSIEILPIPADENLYAQTHLEPVNPLTGLGPTTLHVGDTLSLATPTLDWGEIWDVTLDRITHDGDVIINNRRDGT